MVPLGDLWGAIANTSVVYAFCYGVTVAVYAGYKVFLAPTIQPRHIGVDSTWTWVIVVAVAVVCFQQVAKGVAELFAFLSAAPRFVVVLIVVPFSVMLAGFKWLPFILALGLWFVFMWYCSFLDDLFALADRHDQLAAAERYRSGESEFVSALDKDL